MKFYQLEARVHLNTVTWPYSRHTGLVIFAQRQEDEMGLYGQVGERAADKIVFSMAELTMSLSGERRQGEAPT